MDGREYKPDRLKDAIKAAQTGTQPIELLVKHGDLYRTVRVDYHDAESETYFATRPPGSRIAAWASPQSQRIPGRAELDERYAEVEARFAGSEIPLPPFWGGYRVVPEAIEFWQGRENRFHDRLRYERTADGWTRTRLAP